MLRGSELGKLFVGGWRLASVTIHLMLPRGTPAVEGNGWEKLTIHSPYSINYPFYSHTQLTREKRCKLEAASCVSTPAENGGSPFGKRSSNTFFPTDKLANSTVIYSIRSVFPSSHTLKRLVIIAPAISSGTLAFLCSGGVPLLFSTLHDALMFTNSRRQEERTGKYGTPRVQYLQELVNQFQNANDEETKEKIVANLANFAYDPFNYTFLRQLNVLELFLDCLTEPNERLVEFGIGGICNSCTDPSSAAVVSHSGGIPLVIQCLSSPVRNTVSYALGALYYLCNESNTEEILKPEVVDVIERYASAGAVNVSFSNLAQAFLDKHAYWLNRQDGKHTSSNG